MTESNVTPYGLDDIPNTGWVTPPGPETPMRVTITVDVRAWSEDNAIGYAIEWLSYLADAFGDYDTAPNVNIRVEPLKDTP